MDHNINTISTFGSHSALDVCSGAKELGFNTLVLAKKNREKTYAKTYASRILKNNEKIGCVDSCIVCEDFELMKEKEIINLMDKSIFIPNRSFAVYLGYDFIENNFSIPIFGNKYLLRAEERNIEKNQYYFLEKAKIKIPKKINSLNEMQENKIYIVKINEKARNYERAFFLCSSLDEYEKKTKEMIEKNIIDEKQLKNAIIEEYIIGVHINLNFFASKINDTVELLGLDTRRQTNIEGLTKIPAINQLEIPNFRPKTIEAGHIACTLRESLLEKAQKIGEDFVNTINKEDKKGLIGPFALQCMLSAEDEKEEFNVFDVSFRMPGSPGTKFTPYSYYLYGKPISFGKRIAVEIKDAIKFKELEKITS